MSHFQKSLGQQDKQDLQNTPSIIALAGPTALTNLLLALVGVINLKMVSTLGTSVIAAVSTGNRIFFVFQAFLISVNAGTTALVARHWGAGEFAQASDVLKMSLMINTVIAFVSTFVILIFSDSLAAFFGLDTATTSLIADYISVYGLFIVGFALHLCFGAALRAAGDPLTPLYLGATANIFTVLISYTFIFGMFGAPSLGIRGSAIGVSGFLISGLLFYYFWNNNHLLIKWSSFKGFNKYIARRLISVGYPAGLEQLVIQSGFLLFFWIVAFYGTEALAAYGIGVSILAFSFTIGLGFSIAAATLVGQHLGRNDASAARAVGWRSTRLAVLIMSIPAMLVFVFARPLASFMADEPEVIQRTVTFIYILALVQPLMAIDFTLAGALRGAGDTRFPFFSSLIGLIVFRIGTALMFLHLNMDVTWVYAALILDYAVKAILLTFRFRSATWVTALDRQQ